MKELRKKIFEHIELNESQELKKLLKENEIDLNFRDRSGCCPLYIAVEKINEEMVDTLLMSGADPNYLSQKESPLFNYVFRWSKENSNNDPTISIAKKLIEAGANLQHKIRSNDLSLLHDAVSKKNRLLVELLIESGADVNEHKNRSKATPICFPSTPEIVQLLIDAGANLNHLQKNKLSILISYRSPRKAQVAEHLKMVELILENMKTIGDEILTLMGILIKDLDNKVFEVMVKRKIDFKDETLIKLLFDCVAWENTVAAKLLLEHYDFKFDHVPEASQNPLYRSMSFGFRRFVQLFLNHGAEIANLPAPLKQKLKEEPLSNYMKKLLKD